MVFDESSLSSIKIQLHQESEVTKLLHIYGTMVNFVPDQPQCCSRSQQLPLSYFALVWVLLSLPYLFSHAVRQF